MSKWCANEPDDAPEVRHTRDTVGTFRGRARVVALVGADAWALLEDAPSSDVAGGATYDAHIVACARQAGAARIATFNVRHFERMNLGNVTLLVPG